MREAAVVARGLVKRFGDFTAVDGVDLTVERGTRHAIIGPNGAGKSTLFNLLTGELVPDAGTVTILGKDVGGAPPNVVARTGVGRSFQTSRVFGSFTVRENVQFAVMARERHTVRFWGLASRRCRADADRILDDVGLLGRADDPAETLSHGDQRTLELALSLALDPQILMLDEPTAGMSPQETRRAMALVRELADARRLTVLFTEHDMEVVFGTAEVITVLADGAILVQGSPDEIRNHPRVREVYFGAHT